MAEDPTNAGAERLHIVRVTFEAVSPLSVGSGESRSETRKDPGSGEEGAVRVAEVQRDANGLPAIPGSGMQGILRRLAAESWGRPFADAMFGREEAEGGAAGRVACGWACAHDANDRAVSGLRLDGLDADDILALLAGSKPLWRDHVALNDRHSVDGHRKFARTAVPAGARFSLELSGWGDDAFLDGMRRIVELFRHPRLRLGAGSGRGYGRIRLLAASGTEAPLDDANALRGVRAQPPSAPLETDVLKEIGASVPRTSDTVLRLSLECRDLLRIGAAGLHAKTLTHRAQRARSATTGELFESPGLGAPEDEGDEAVLKLLREPRIVWKDGEGRVVWIDGEPVEGPVPVEQLRFPVPGSSIRGPLTHRMLFHANRLSGLRIDADEWLGEDEEGRKALEKTYGGYAERSPGLATFLGAAKETEASGQASRVLFDDAELCGAKWIVGIDHVSIDRFTGGARDGALFREEALFGGRIEATVRIRPPPERDKMTGRAVGHWPEETATAFLLAVRDLCRGRLALGGRSYGDCSGTARFEGKHAQAWRKAAKGAGVPLGGAQA